MPDGATERRMGTRRGWTMLCVLALLLASCGENASQPEGVRGSTAAWYGDWQLEPDAGGPIEEWILFAGDHEQPFFVVRLGTGTPRH